MERLSAARKAAEVARREGAERYAPYELKQAQEALRQADRAVTLQSARASFRRDYDDAVTLIDRARYLSVLALRQTKQRRDKAREDATRQLNRLVEQLSRAQEIKRYLSPRDPAVSRQLIAAGVDLDVAQRRMEEEDYPAALAAARQGTERVHDVEQILLASIVRYVSHPDLPSWKQWVDQAVRASRGGGTSIVVDKLRRRLTLYRAGKKHKVYPVDLGMGGMERKLRAGDDATPEGYYRIVEVRGPAQTQYYRAFLLNYPNEHDRRRFEQARRRGQIPKGADPGSLIEIHGEGGRDLDWTRGCVALTNPEMDELAPMVRVGTPVAIVGYNPREQEDLW
jgi:L,D-peptidoglycan transpeptidase YkuD (ErfK/YbiS/YcfS/YnhG family)